MRKVAISRRAASTENDYAADDDGDSGGGNDGAGDSLKCDSGNEV